LSQNEKVKKMRHLILAPLVAIGILATSGRAADKPNILVIFGDDIGIANVSDYSDGVMGYETPSIDRLANEGLRFPDLEEVN
jgi:arylsulfatase